MDVEAWLRSLGLEQYEAIFRENAIDETVLPDLTDQDLEKLGVLLGHRRKLLRAIAELKTVEKGARVGVAPAAPLPLTQDNQGNVRSPSISPAYQFRLRRLPYFLCSILAFLLASWIVFSAPPDLKGVAWVIIAIAIYLLAVGRVHDFGHSAWWALLVLVPLFGFIFWLYIFLPESAEGGDKKNGEKSISLGDGAQSRSQKGKQESRLLRLFLIGVSVAVVAGSGGLVYLLSRGAAPLQQAQPKLPIQREQKPTPYSQAEPQPQQTPGGSVAPQAPKSTTQLQNQTPLVPPQPKTQVPATAHDSKNDLVPVKIGTGIIWKKGKEARVGPLKIEADAGNYALKLVDSKSNNGVLMIFVGAHQAFETKVPLGTYKIFGATGSVWYGEEQLFGPATTYFVLRRKNGSSMARNDEFPITRDDKTYKGYDIQLQKVVGGDLSTDPITPSEFNHH